MGILLPLNQQHIARMIGGALLPSQPQWCRSCRNRGAVLQLTVVGVQGQTNCRRVAAISAFAAADESVCGHLSERPPSPSAFETRLECSAFVGCMKDVVGVQRKDYEPTG